MQLFDIYLDSGTPAPSTFVPGQPLAVQPTVWLFGKQGVPLEGKTVIAFASQSPFLDSNGTLLISSVSLQTSGDIESHDLQGQRYATLTNAISTPSGPDGSVTFRGLTITGTSSPFVYIGFYCEGACLSAVWLLVAVSCLLFGCWLLFPACSL